MIAFLTRRRVAIPAALAFAVLGLAVLGSLDPGGWMVLTQAFDHSTFATVAICALLIVALAGIRTTSWWLRSAKIVFSAALAFVILGILLTMNLLAQDFQVQQDSAAPDHRPYRLVVSEGHDMIDPVWTLKIRSGHGLRAREWRFGCLNGDDYEYGLHSAAWAGPGQVVVTIGDDDALRRVVVPINTKNGRPSGSANTWDGCDG